MTVIYKETDVFVGLGSNLKNRRKYLENAKYLLKKQLFKNINKSPIYECNALLKKGAPKEWGKNFLNMVIKGNLKNNMELAKMFEIIQQIELSLGKNKLAVWAPRAIDIDIIAIGNLVLNEDGIIIPHLGIDQRQFVLQPLKDLSPNWQHPVSLKNISEIISKMPKMDFFKKVS